MDRGTVQHVTTSMWATLACSVTGPSASRGEKQSYDIQNDEVKPSVKNNEKYPL